MGGGLIVCISIVYGFIKCTAFIFSTVWRSVLCNENQTLYRVKEKFGMTDRQTSRVSLRFIVLLFFIIIVRARCDVQYTGMIAGAVHNLNCVEACEMCIRMGGRDVCLPVKLFKPKNKPNKIVLSLYDKIDRVIV